jgi:hypothetical protein
MQFDKSILQRTVGECEKSTVFWHGFKSPAVTQIINHIPTVALPNFDEKSLDQSCKKLLLSLKDVGYALADGLLHCAPMA